VITLYEATHNITGLKYFGKTELYHSIEDLQRFYHGSGKYWKNHLKKHGDDVTMKILHSSNDINSLALMYSKFWNIVESKDYANLIDESGLNGGKMYEMTNEIKEKISLSLMGQTSPRKGVIQTKEEIQKAVNVRYKNNSYNTVKPKISGKNSYNSKIYELYDENENLIYTIFYNLKNWAAENNFPINELRNSIKENRAMYSSKIGKSRAIKNGYKKCINWKIIQINKEDYNEKN